MRTNADRNWDLIGEMLAAESSGKSPRLFSSRKTLFGIPSALDQELASLDETSGQAAKPSSGEDTSETEPSSDFRSAASAKPTRNKAVSSKRNKATTVRHPLEAVFDSNSRVLVLGTMPSPKSRETGFYYNHPQNRFWKVMAALFDEPIPETNDEKRGLVLRHGIALWDVLAECTIEGASDGSIADCVPNNIGSLLAKAPIEAIFCTGAKAAELYDRYCKPQTQMDCTRLPSTSPANATVSLEQLIEAYEPIRQICERQQRATP